MFRALASGSCRQRARPSAELTGEIIRECMCGRFGAAARWKYGVHGHGLHLPIGQNLLQRAALELCAATPQPGRKNAQARDRGRSMQRVVGADRRRAEGGDIDAVQSCETDAEGLDAGAD
jgi:hypothetical protein